MLAGLFFLIQQPGWVQWPFLAAKFPASYNAVVWSDEGVLRWFGHVKRMGNDRIAKRVSVGYCAGSRSLGRSQMRWTDTMNDCLKKRGLDIRQARRIVHDRSVWRGFLRGNA